MMITYNEILDTIDSYPIIEQLEIAKMIRKRAIEARRNQLIKEIRKSQKELKKGLIKPMTVDEIMKEITS